MTDMGKADVEPVALLVLFRFIVERDRLDVSELAQKGLKLNLKSHSKIKSQIDGGGPQTTSSRASDSPFCLLLHLFRRQAPGAPSSTDGYLSKIAPERV